MLQPLKDRLIVKRDETRKFTESGLTIPELAQEKELFGTVIAVGPDVRDVEVGQRVLFGKVDGVQLDSRYVDGDVDCILIRDEQVRGVVQ